LSATAPQRAAMLSGGRSSALAMMRSERSIERYLQIYRPVLARGTAETDPLWLAMDGKPMSYTSMGQLITETTRMTIGVAVSLISSVRRQ
jgi:site-specific recombinase XerD